MMIESDPRAEVASPSAADNVQPTLLYVDPASARAYVPALRGRYKVVEARTETEALSALAASMPAVVITELALPDGDGLGICREARAGSRTPAVVLVTTADIERIPLALAAGCDGVLLKPFAPNLLYSRLGRLVRENGHGGPGNHAAGAETCCPACVSGTIVAFDHASHRREWYACLACQKVWMGPRRDEWW